VRDVLEALLAELDRGRRAVLVTVVRSSGSTPRGPGARMLVRSDGTSVGTIGGGAFEAVAQADARDLLAGGGGRTAIKRYTFTERGEDALGMACGGNAEILLEVVEAGELLVIFGAGHVGCALAKAAAAVGFRPALVDDRPEACEAAERLGVGDVRRCDPEWSRGVPVTDGSSYVAVVTRCHRTDRMALRHALRRPARYVGLIGSRRKREVIFRELRDEDGIAVDDLRRVRCPIGLPLGGETPEEIAVSIVAELLQVRHGTGGPPADTRSDAPSGEGAP
jgi:xanthine dehydrogenase accessory factor